MSGNDVVRRRLETMALVRQSLLGSLDGLTQNALWWRPAPHAFPIARLLQHIRDAYVFWLWREGEERPAPIPRDAPLASILDSLNAVYDHFVRILQGTSDAGLDAPWPAAAPAALGNTNVTLGFVTKRLMQHSLYHQAQIDYIRHVLDSDFGKGRDYWERASDALSACP